jgi:purine-binding chemotaxis protein CheW
MHTQPEAKKSSGKYMTFRLDTENYGVEILKVIELIGYVEVTRVPGTASSVRGLLNLRGRVIPVVDLRAKFGMGQTPATDQTVIIVVQVQVASSQTTLGVLVDEVLDVLSVGVNQVEPAPPTVSGALPPDYMVGMAKSEKRIVFLLDIDAVVAPEARA